MMSFMYLHIFSFIYLFICLFVDVSSRAGPVELLMVIVVIFHPHNIVGVVVSDSGNRCASIMWHLFLLQLL